MAEAAVRPRRAALSPRPRILDLYLVRGVAGPFVVILLAVGAAMMLERALRLIHELAASGADIGYFFPLLARLVPYYLDLALPAAFTVALVLLVARLDDRLELEAMLASGWSLSRIAAPLVALGLGVGAAGLVAGGWLEPLGRYGYRTQRVEAINSGRIGHLAPRALYQPADSLALTFDRREGGGRVGGIFVWQRLSDGRELVLTSASGRVGFAPAGRLFGIDLDRGRYVAADARGGLERIAFDRMAFRESLLVEEARHRRGSDQKELTVTELAEEMRSGGRGIEPRHLEAELYSRLSRVAIVPLLPLLVLPLAFATKKGRRTLGILLSFALLALFHHGMNFAKGLARFGGADPGAAILGTAALCAAVALLVFVSGRRLPSHGPIHSALKPLGAALARLAPRERALPSLSGRTLATYLAWQLGKWTMVALIAIVAMLQIVDVFERADDIVSRGHGVAAVLRYAWLRLPGIVQQALPIAALSGAMVTFAGLGRSLETTAIRASGVSQWRILAMALPVPLAVAAASFLLAERVVPESQRRLAEWRQASLADAPPPARWFRIGDEIVRAEGAAAGGRRLAGVSIFRRDPAGLLAEWVSAPAARLEGGGWRLYRAEVRRFAGQGREREHAASLAWPAPLLPEDVAALFAGSRAASAAAARRSLEAEAPAGLGEAPYATRLHRSAAEPLAPLVMLLLALPLAFAHPRAGTPWPALLYAGGGGLLYLVADSVLTVAAQVGYLPPLAGAWLAPALFGLAALAVLVYAER